MPIDRGTGPGPKLPKHSNYGGIPESTARLPLTLTFTARLPLTLTLTARLRLRTRGWVRLRTRGWVRLRTRVWSGLSTGAGLDHLLTRVWITY